MRGFEGQTQFNPDWDRCWKILRKRPAKVAITPLGAIPTMNNTQIKKVPAHRPPPILHQSVITCILMSTGSHWLRTAARTLADENRDFSERAIEAAECLRFIKRIEVISDIDWLTIDLQAHYLVGWAATHPNAGIKFDNLIERLQTLAAKVESDLQDREVN